MLDPAPAESPGTTEWLQLLNDPTIWCCSFRAASRGLSCTVAGIAVEPIIFHGRPCIEADRSSPIDPIRRRPSSVSDVADLRVHAAPSGNFHSGVPPEAAAPPKGGASDGFVRRYSGHAAPGAAESGKAGRAGSSLRRHRAGVGGFGR